MNLIRSLALFSFTAVLITSCSQALVEHTCTDACEHGEHQYAHGEQGHTCDAQCEHIRAKRN